MSMFYYATVDENNRLVETFQCEEQFRPDNSVEFVYDENTFPANDIPYVDQDFILRNDIAYFEPSQERLNFFSKTKNTNNLLDTGLERIENVELTQIETDSALCELYEMILGD